MPQYYPPPENWDERGTINIIFKPWWRNLPILRSFPLWVGDRVAFHLRIEKPASPQRPGRAVHEAIDDHLVNVFPLQGMDIDVQSLPIPSEGNLRFTFGYQNYLEPTDPLIITANVQSKDRWWVGCAGLLIGAILTVLSGVATGLIQIDKMWHIWNPFAR